MESKAHLAKLLDEIFQPEEPEGPPAPILPEAALDAYHAVKDYLVNVDQLIRCVSSFEQLLPKQKTAAAYTEKHFKNDFFGYHGHDRVFKLQESLSPIGVALITLHDFFEKDRFTSFDPRQIPDYKKLALPLLYEEPIWMPITLGPHHFTVPETRQLWIHDSVIDARFIVLYGVSPGGGGLRIQIESSWEQNAQTSQLLSEVKDAVFMSKYFRGQVLELSSRGFSIMDLAEQNMPVIDTFLTQELEKNVMNMFRKTDAFKAYGLPTKRAIIVEGVAGCGKTALCRYLAFTLKGQVTVLWVTSKAIGGPSDIQSIFEMARKLSPALLIMEDLDLIAGSRDHDAECLGEMLNQLDGIQPNESLVVVATTNKVKSLDLALRDRPGRFDRIYQMGRPSSSLAEQIARYYLKARGVSDDIVNGLSFGAISKGDLTGAQIVEVVKGGIFEAIHRNCLVNDICLNASYKGLMDQRKAIEEE